MMKSNWKNSKLYVFATLKRDFRRYFISVVYVVRNTCHRMQGDIVHKTFFVRWKTNKCKLKYGQIALLVTYFINNYLSVFVRAKKSKHLPARYRLSFN